MTDTVKDQIFKVRDTGKSNMLDIKAVQRIAYDMELYELVLFLEESPKDYVSFILTGEKNV